MPSSALIPFFWGGGLGSLINPFKQKRAPFLIPGYWAAQKMVFLAPRFGRASEVSEPKKMNKPRSPSAPRSGTGYAPKWQWRGPVTSNFEFRMEVEIMGFRVESDLIGNYLGQIYVV